MCTYQQGLIGKKWVVRLWGLCGSFLLFCFAFKVSVLKFCLGKIVILKSSNLHLPMGLNAKN